MKMYRTDGYSTRIEEREITRTTEKMVFYMGEYWGKTKERRENKEGFGHGCKHKWHNSWEEARAWLLEIAEKQVSSYRLALQRANGAVGNIKGMQK